MTSRHSALMARQRRCERPSLLSSSCTQVQANRCLSFIVCSPRSMTWMATGSMAAICTRWMRFLAQLAKSFHRLQTLSLGYFTQTRPCTQYRLRASILEPTSMRTHRTRRAARGPQLLLSSSSTSLLSEHYLVGALQQRKTRVPIWVLCNLTVGTAWPWSFHTQMVVYRRRLRCRRVRTSHRRRHHHRTFHLNPNNRRRRHPQHHRHYVRRLHRTDLAPA